MKPKIVVFGAGNIGRSFVAQVFSQAGYHVLFVDIDKNLIKNMNSIGEYKVVIKKDENPDRFISVSPVSAIDGTDSNAVIQAVSKADIIATAVGAGALQHLFPVIAHGVEHRKSVVDIIIAENISDGTTYFKNGLLRHFDCEDSIDKVGLVQTSIGKMVPIMNTNDIEADPLQIFSEEYNTLIVDKNGFKNCIPDIPELLPVEPIKAYVSRKLFIHNLGHAAVAYLGYQSNPETIYIWQALEDGEVARNVRSAMEESADALLIEYSDSFTRKDLYDHIDDLLERFRNRSLGDTIFRVGRDIARKLSLGDRLIGALDLIRKHDLSSRSVEMVIRAALDFKKTDEVGIPFMQDEIFITHLDIMSELLSRKFRIKTEVQQSPQLLQQ